MTGLLLALKGVISEDELETEATDEAVSPNIELSPHTLDKGKSEDNLTPDSNDFTAQISHGQPSPEVNEDLPAPPEALEHSSPDHPPEATISVFDENLGSIHRYPLDPTARGSDVPSPRASDKPSRDDSVDSGYAEFRTSTPPPLTHSPQPSQWRQSTLNLLSSPFGSPTTRAFSPARGRLSALISPRFGSFPSSLSERAPSPTDRDAETVETPRRHSDDTKSLHSAILSSFPALGKDQNPPQDVPFGTPSPSRASLDSPGTYPALPLGSNPPQRDDAGTKPPTMNGVTFNRKRASSTVTVMPQSEGTESPPPLPESLPWAADAEDDTVTSMYGLYHSSSSDHVWSPPSPVQNYSRPSSSASFYPTQPSSVAPELLSPRSPPSDNSLAASPLVPSRSSPTLSVCTDLSPPSSTIPIGFRDQKRRTSTALRRPQPLILSPQHSPAVELRQPFSSGPRSLKPLRLSMILNSGPSLVSPNENPFSAPSPALSVQSDSPTSNGCQLSSARSSITPERILSTPSSRSLSPLPLNTPSGSHQHYLSNFGSLSHVTAPSPTPSQVSTSSSAIRRQYNPLIPNREFRNSVYLHSRGSSTLSEPFHSVQEEEEDVWNARNEINLNIDPEETIRCSLSASRSPFLGNPEEKSAQRSSAFSESPVSTTAPVLDQMIDAHVANPSRSPAITSGSPPARLLTRHHTPTFPHAQTANSTPHLGPSPVFTKDPGPIAITNSRHPTQTHTRRQPSHAIATPRPTLMFAIASDDVSQVQNVLESGEADPNDQVGPQSALKFALTNAQLTNRLEIVKTLLAYGADPAGLKNPSSGGQEYSRRSSVVISGSSPAHVGHSLNASEIDGRKEVDPAFEAMKSQMDPATRYFINRADAPKTRRASSLIHRSFFRPLARMRYDIIGQDCAFEQLFRCLSIQSQNLSASPLVVMLCGPSGHGKSLFARKFGSLLNVPTHTVNMTTLSSTHDLWQSYSMSPYEEPSTFTLAEFLTDNEGKRCVVVLDVRVPLPYCPIESILTLLLPRKSTKSSTKRPSSLC